ncbi:MAG: helix-turn-helix domain-containing protein, partial [Bdellovibrionia bacterium]
RLRGSRVVLDSDLTGLFQTSTSALNQAVRRNSDRFPGNFMFKLTQSELELVNAQNAVMNFKTHGGRRSMPRCFTQVGVAILSVVLKSDRAIQVNTAIMRAFDEIQEEPLSLQEAAKNQKSITDILIKIESKLEQIQLGSIISAVKPKELIELNPQPVLLLREKTNGKVEKITKAVSIYFGITCKNILVATRVKSIVVPRQIAIYLIRQHSNMTLKEIAGYFGGKDHTTILHACRKIEMALNKDEKTRNAVDQIQNHILS